MAGFGRPFYMGTLAEALPATTSHSSTIQPRVCTVQLSLFIFSHTPAQLLAQLFSKISLRALQIGAADNMTAVHFVTHLAMFLAPLLALLGFVVLMQRKRLGDVYTKRKPQAHAVESGYSSFTKVD